jgi:uncharacterized protein YqkB
MKIEMNETTERRLRDSLGSGQGCFKLYYDTESCGCNGVLTIQLRDRPLETDVLVQEQPFTFVVDRQQRQQFDDTMTVEADPGYPSYKVSGNSGLFSSNVRLRDVRGAEETAAGTVSCQVPARS